MAASCARTWCVRPVTSSTQTSHTAPRSAPSSGYVLCAVSTSRACASSHLATAAAGARRHSSTTSSHRFQFRKRVSPSCTISPSTLTLRSSRACDRFRPAPRNASGPNGPGYIQCTAVPSGRGRSERVNAAYVFVTAGVEGLRHTLALNAATAALVFPSTVTPDVLESSLCVTPSAPRERPSAPRRTWEGHSDALDSCAWVGRRAGLQTDEEVVVLVDDTRAPRVAAEPASVAVPSRVKVDARALAWRTGRAVGTGRG